MAIHLDLHSYKSGLTVLPALIQWLTLRWENYSISHHIFSVVHLFCLFKWIQKEKWISTWQSRNFKSKEWSWSSYSWRLGLSFLSWGCWFWHGLIWIRIIWDEVKPFLRFSWISDVLSLFTRHLVIMYSRWHSLHTNTC